MIDGADHMYTGEEAQVVRVIAEWADGLAPIGPGKKNVPDRR
jgi:hypothetical protein